MGAARLGAPGSVLIMAASLLAASALTPTGAAAQEQADRPWLRGLPLAELSLRLPEAREPNLTHDCDLPEGFAQIAAVTSDGAYSDPRYIGWLRQYYTCDYAGLVQSVEADLTSGKPHPFADAVWAMAMHHSGKLTANWSAGLDPALVNALGPTPELYRLYFNERATPETYAYLRSLTASDLEGRPWARQFDRSLRVEVEAISPARTLSELETDPDNFLSWWNADRRDKEVIEGVRALAAPGGALADHPFMPAFLDYLTQWRWDSQSRIELSDLWLERFPNDRFALQRKAQSLAELNRNEQAAVIGSRAALVSPMFFFTSSAEYSYKAGDPESGDALLALSPGGEDERFSSYLRELEDAQFAHQTRSLAERMIAQGRAVRSARRELRSNFAEAGQTALALEQARLVWNEGAPTWHDAGEMILALHKDGLSREALTAFDSASARLGQPNWIMISNAIQASEAIKDTDRTRALIALAKTLPSPAESVLRAEIKLHERLEEHAKVVGLSRKLLSEFQGYRSDYETLYKAAYALRETAGLDEAFAWASASSLNALEAHYAAVNTLREVKQGARADQIVELAKAEFPDRFFHFYLADINGEAAQSIAQYTLRMDAILAALPGFVGGDKEWAARNIADLAQKAYRARVVGRDQLASAAELFERYRPEMDLERADKSAQALYSALGEPDKAAAVWREKARNVLAFGWPVDRMNIGDEKARDEAFLATWRGLSRNRFSNVRLADAMQVHTLYGGSSIFAVCLGEWADQNYPEALPTIRGFRDRASNRFGGDDQYFRRRYNNGTSIGASENYVNWYQETKRKALNGSNFVDFDCERGVVTTVDRSGRMKVQQDDYRTGKVLLVAEGSAWVRYEYREEGELERLIASDGREIRLLYNDDNKIRRMVDSAEGTLEFVYNDMGKPIQITKVDVGVINVTYDEAGNILSVDSDQGSAMALQVTRAFQNLLELSKPENSAQLLNKAEPEIQELARSMAYGETAPTAADVSRAAGALEKVRRTNRTASSTMGDIDLITQALLGDPLQTATAKDFAAFGAALHGLYVAVSPFGLPEDRWVGWTDFLQLAEARASEKPIAGLLSEIRKNPLKPMEVRTAVNLSELGNPGYWYVDTPGAFIPPRLRSGVEYEAVAVRSNGDMIAGSNVGLIVQRQGNWRRYAFDAARNAWKRDDLAEFPSDPIVISSFAELPGNRMAIGTNRGIYVVGEEYTATIDRAGSGTGGLASGAVTDLFFDGSILHVASAGGVSQIAVSAAGELGEARTIGTMMASRIDAGPDGAILVAGDAGVWLVSDGKAIAIASIKADDAALSIEDGRVLILSRGRLLSTQPEGTGWSTPVELTHGASARLGNSPAGLERVELGGVQSVVALGEDGFAVWQNGYFQHFALPYSDNLPAASAASLANGGGLVAGADGALYRFEPGRIRTFDTGPIFASAYDAQRDLTYFADGGRIIAAPSTLPGQTPEFTTFDRVSATHLDIAPDGALIANDGNTILRYPPGELREQVLFEADPFCPEAAPGAPKAPCSARLEGLLAASDGSVWATAGASAFRWKDGEVTEFSWFRDPVGFPVKTNWLSKVIELPDGGVVISASNQSYVVYEGEKLTGQNLVYRNGRFEKFDDSTLFTSSTLIGDRAILGSLSGFYEADQLGVQSLVSSEDKSYIALRDRRPNLYLGGEAARIGEDTLLFPTPAGIVVHQNGSWFYPERINWQFPDPSKADIGGRHTYAVEVDKAGRIYAATDQGIVIFQHLGGDAEDFLMENARPDLAFESFERRKFRRQVATLMNGIDPGAPEFAELQKVMQARTDIEALRQSAQDLATPVKADGPASRAADNELDNGSRIGPPPGSELANAIRAKEREYTRLLAELERDDPGLAQLVTIQPLELAALQDKVPSDAVIVQYIPQGNRLHIHVVGKGINHVEQVDVDLDTLMDTAITANFFLEDIAPQAEGLISKGDSIFAASDAQDQLPLDTPTGSLKLLYEWLIAPVESQIDGANRVYVSAAGALNYVPFAALTRERDGQRQYAVERYNFAMVPTTYLLSLVLSDTGTTQSTALVYGNPDGTLPYAEREAADVRSKVAVRMSDVILRTGKDATLQTLTEYGASSGLLHLATHGRLNPTAPERSHLVLGGDQTRLDAVDIMTLDLGDAELVFLSACETGRGGDGLEFATLARAFSHAGVPTTIASLWRVGDNATLNLVSDFYDTYDGDASAALRAAQREMIATPGAMSHPAAWAAFQVYGRGFGSQQ